MTFHKRMTAGLVACCFAAASVGCTSMKTIHPKTIHPYSDPAAPTFGRLKAGDTVVLQTRDGRRERFVVQRVDGDAIVSPSGKRYTRGDIERLQRRSFSGTKTAFLIGGAVSAAFVAYAMAVASALSTLGG